jgi:hypothetical protein
MNQTINEIQSKLGIPQTGVLDDFTQAAWKNYCIKTGVEYEPLIGDVAEPEEHHDPKIGFLTTDKQDAPKIKSYPLKVGQFQAGPTKKDSLFLHFTAGWENPYNVVNDWNNDTRGTIGTQFVIGGRNCQTLVDKYDGEIVECMNYKNYAWHLGIGNVPLHRNSIGIEVCNFGPLHRVGNDFYSWANKRVVPSEIVELSKDFHGYKFFHKITNDQLHALNFLIAKIAKDTGIDPTKGLKERLKKMDPWKAFDYDQDIKDGKLKGLFCHTNVSPKNRFGSFEKWDWYPDPNLIDLINSF